MKGLMKGSFVSKIGSAMTFYHVVLNIHPFLNEATGHSICRYLSWFYDRIYCTSGRKGTTEKIYLILDKFFGVIYYQLALITLIIHNYLS